jgi:hypothetical protein
MIAGSDRALLDDLGPDLVRRLRRLVELKESTRPKRGPAEGKNAKADEAITQAGLVFNVLAGWAIDHQIGVATIEDRSLSLDDHQHELDGRSSRVWRPKAMQRAALALFKVLGWLTFNPFRTVIEMEMEKIINGGNSSILFSPAKAHRGNHQLWLHRLRAVEHTYTLVERGLSMTAARKAVAEAYGQPMHDNIRKWEEQLGEDRVGVGHLAVVRERISRYVALDDEPFNLEEYKRDLKRDGEAFKDARQATGTKSPT